MPKQRPSAPVPRPAPRPTQGAGAAQKRPQPSPHAAPATHPVKKPRVAPPSSSKNEAAREAAAKEAAAAAAAAARMREMAAAAAAARTLRREAAFQVASGEAEAREAAMPPASVTGGADVPLRDVAPPNVPTATATTENSSKQVDHGLTQAQCEEILQRAQELKASTKEGLDVKYVHGWRIKVKARDTGNSNDVYVTNAAFVHANLADSEHGRKEHTYRSFSSLREALGLGVQRVTHVANNAAKQKAEAARVAKEKAAAAKEKANAAEVLAARTAAPPPAGEADASLPQHRSRRDVTPNSKRPIMVDDDDEEEENAGSIEDEDEESRPWADELRGRRVRVWWDGDDTWFKGKFADFRHVEPSMKKCPTGRSHLIRYDDGDSKWHCLFLDKWQLLDAPHGSRAASSSAASSSTAAPPPVVNGGQSSSNGVQEPVRSGKGLVGRQFKCFLKRENGPPEKKVGRIESFIQLGHLYVVMFEDNHQMTTPLFGDKRFSKLSIAKAADSFLVDDTDDVPQASQDPQAARISPTLQQPSQPAMEKSAAPPATAPATAPPATAVQAAAAPPAAAPPVAGGHVGSVSWRRLSNKPVAPSPPLPVADGLPIDGLPMAVATEILDTGGGHGAGTASKKAKRDGASAEGSTLPKKPKVGLVDDNEPSDDDEPSDAPFASMEPQGGGSEAVPSTEGAADEEAAPTEDGDSVDEERREEEAREAVATISAAVLEAKKISEARKNSPPKGPPTRSPMTALSGGRAPTAPSAPATVAAAATSAPPVVPQLARCVPSVAPQLARWHCVGGEERWTLTLREAREAEEVAEPTERIVTLSKLRDEHDAPNVRRMIHAWEMSQPMLESVASGSEDERLWARMLQLARADAPNVSACCRMLLLIETSVQSDEMLKPKAWDRGRNGWLKLLRKIGAGEPMDPSLAGEHSAGGHLVASTMKFVQNINSTATFTPAFAEGFVDWTKQLELLGATADNVAGAGGNERRRPPRGAPAPAGVGDDSGLAGFDAAECMRLMNGLCDGLRLQKWSQ